MKIKLLFIPRFHANPNTGKPDIPPFFPPLGISTLTSYLKENGINVNQDDLDIKVYRYNQRHKENKRIDLKIFFDEKRVDNFLKNKVDLEFEEECEKILKLTNLNGYDIIGFSLMPTDNPSAAGVAAALAKILKEKYDPLILIGGSVREIVERSLLNTGFIDFRVFGHPNDSSAEIITVKLCEAFENGKELKALPGVHYLEGGKHITNPSNSSKKEKTLITRPCFEGLPIDLYRSEMKGEINGNIEKEEILILPYFFMKSCVNKCAFCSCSLEDWFNIKSVSEIANDIEYFSKKYNTKLFYFHNATVNPIYKHTEKVADEIIKRDLNILWTDCANFSPLDKNLLEKLKKAGAARLVFGFEGGSPTMLRYVGKPFMINQAEKVLKTASSLGIWCEMDLICGFPYETEEDINSTIEFIRKNKKHLQGCSLNKFWVDGMFLKYPERYGIHILNWTNTHLNWATTGFNERYGSKWEEKVKQIEEHFKKIQSEIDRNFYPPPHPRQLFFNILTGVKGQKFNL